MITNNNNETEQMITYIASRRLYTNNINTKYILHKLYININSIKLIYEIGSKVTKKAPERC